MKKIIVLSIALLISISGYSQLLELLEPNIMEGVNPDGELLKIKFNVYYQADFRAIAWSVPQIKDYEYSNEVFDRYGYRKISSDYQGGSAYISCQKHILIEVRPVENVLKITMSWFASKDQNGKFIFCK